MESLEKSGRLVFRAVGSSMLPTIRPNTEVRIRRAGVEDVAVGDVALIRVPDGVRLHRVVEKHGNSLVTRGDNHRHCDPPTEADRVLGVLE